jgi:hypothetical protein
VGNEDTHTRGSEVFERTKTTTTGGGVFQAGGEEELIQEQRGVKYVKENWRKIKGA